MIKLIKDKQPLYGLIYSLSLMKLETLKTYIATYLKTRFICPSKSSADVPIFFNKKPNGNIWLCVDYQSLNNLTIKNCYLLPLICEFLDWLGCARRLTQLNLTNAYHEMRIWKDDKLKTAFRTRYGNFKYQVMSFGFSNALACFQGTSRRSLPRNWTSLLLFTWMIFKFLFKTLAKRLLM